MPLAISSGQRVGWCDAARLGRRARHIAEFGRRFGCDVYDGFGSTENAVIISRTEDTPPGSIGQPWEGVAVYDWETRTECPRAVFDSRGVVTNLDVDDPPWTRAERGTDYVVREATAGAR